MSPEGIWNNQGPMHQESMQAPFKKARVDEERPHKQGLAQQQDDHMVPSPFGCRLCGMGVMIPTALKRAAVRIIGAGWL
jgi:hypothetical protein